MKKYILLFITIILFISNIFYSFSNTISTTSGLQNNEIINKYNFSTISNIKNDDSITNEQNKKMSNENIDNTKKVTDKEKIEKVLNNCILCLKNLDFNGLENNIEDEIAFKNDIKRIIANYNLDKFANKYFGMMTAEIDNLTKINDNELKANIVFSVVDEAKLTQKVIISFIAKNLFNLGSFQSPNVNTVKQIIELYANSITEKSSKKTIKYELSFVKYGDSYKIKNINNLIMNISNSLNKIFEKFQ